MIRTLKISFSLKNTYRVNGILHSLKQIPLLKKLLPDALYGIWGLKVFANVLSLLWEACTIFLGKFLHFLLMVCGAGMLYDRVDTGQAILHILFFLTIIGSYSNTLMFNPSRDKYYAMILMRMDARAYTLVNYTYSLLKVAVGFLPFTLVFGLMSGLPMWLCLLLPFSVTGYKLTVAAWSLRDYERSGRVYNENKLGRLQWLCMAFLLAAAYGLPAMGAALPRGISAAALLAGIPAGLLGIRRIYSFREYREVNQQLLAQSLNQAEGVKQAAKTASEKKISADTSITSGRHGFEYLNELFIKRHRAILWNSAEKIASVCAFLACGVMLLLYLKPELKPVINEVVMSYLPYFTFIMYMVNRGTNFTQALFMNCDHSLLTYSFYKEPRFVLKLFRIRLREIVKVNAVPALVIGCGLALVLFVSGGTPQVLNYAVLVVSVLCMSVFFSIHYLTIYYLLQPYTAGTEMKGGTYRLVSVLTYLGCYYLMRLRMPTLLFGAMTIVFCVIYSILACVLVYNLAPKTFRLRM